MDKSEHPPERVQLFVSHATSDVSVLAWVTAQVEAMGIRPYLAEHDPQPGRALGDKVVEAIEESAAVLVLLTASGYESAFVQQEIGAARQAGKQVFALVDREILRRDRAMLAGAEVIVVDPGDLAASSATLIASLRDLSAKRGLAPPPLEVMTQPTLQLDMSLQLELSANQLLFGLLLLTACAGVVYLASREGSALALPSA